MEEILNRLLEGEHIYINGYELFLSYTGTYWVRKELQKDGETYWQQVYYKELKDALEYVGYPIPKQLNLFYSN